MPSWHLMLVGVLITIINWNILQTNCGGGGVNANILHNVLGLPTECIYRNVVRPCRFSFSCWLQGGKHAQGCGNNKWLFSCCVPDNEIPNTTLVKMKNPPSNFYNYPIVTHLQAQPQQQQQQQQQLPSKNILRRRADDDNLQYNDCGITKNSLNTIQKRIIGGRPAKFAEYPWQAHIRIAEYQCGGALVSRRFVATAAHCIQQARIKDIIVYLGELDTQNSGIVYEPLPSEKHRVIQRVVHPLFQFRMTQPDRYDLALLKLSRTAGYKSHIAPICLPTTAMELIGRKGIIAGWGKTDVSMGHTGTNILRTASVPIISTDECIEWHESKQINVELYGEMFCAGHPDGHQDACLGDSGGPLVVYEHGRYTLIGITSAGFGCGVDHQPGIYHNVQKTTKWIQDVIYQSM